MENTMAERVPVILKSQRAVGEYLITGMKVVRIPKEREKSSRYRPKPLVSSSTPRMRRLSWHRHGRGTSDSASPPESSTYGREGQERKGQAEGRWTGSRMFHKMQCVILRVKNNIQSVTIFHPSWPLKLPPKGPQIENDEHSDGSKYRKCCAEIRRGLLPACPLCPSHYGSSEVKEGTHM